MNPFAHIFLGLYRVVALNETRLEIVQKVRGKYQVGGPQRAQVLFRKKIFSFFFLNLFVYTFAGRKVNIYLNLSSNNPKPTPFFFKFHVSYGNYSIEVTSEMHKKRLRCEKELSEGGRNSFRGRNSPGGNSPRGRLLWGGEISPKEGILHGGGVKFFIENIRKPFTPSGWVTCPGNTPITSRRWRLPLLETLFLGALIFA